ncbi:MAG: DUF4365 domain-containing protein [Bacteroidales bacterium]|nr:DUF4365 domain-containing protein [Bacteroidales bacterium]
MSGFTPNLSETNTDIIEKKSIDCLDKILSHCDIKTHFTAKDKNANIDGKIELMTEKRIYGNITVQIKTYPSKYHNQAKYDFPTSIFGYAQRCSIELVFLFAVNNKENIAYWKHIDKSLIIKHGDKFNQETITIHFEENETVHKDNIDETVKRWKELYKKTSDLITQTELISQENEQLKVKLEKYQNPTFTIGRDNIIKLQRFIDKYNYLLDYDYNFIKRHYYSNPWKIGIVVFEYGLNELSYIIHKIEKGENGLLIQEIPTKHVKYFTDFIVTYLNCKENAINNNPEKYAFNLIQEKVMELLENKAVLFLTVETAIEYIFDFVNQEGHYLNIKQDESYELIPLRVLLEDKYPKIDASLPFFSMIGNRRININILYDSVLFLIDKGFTYIHRLYPAKGYYGKTGFVSDWYTPDLALKKVRFVYELLPSLFDAYMITAFPYLRDHITFYDGYDLILVNLIYFEGKPERYTQNHQIVVYYLKLVKGTITLPELVISLNFESDIYQVNNISDIDSMIDYFSPDKTIFYRGENFEVMKQEGVDISIIFDNYYIHNILYRHLNDRFKDYFKNINR